jgi:hypothetical protein
MAVRKQYPDDTSYKLARRIDRALGALTDALNDFNSEPRKRSSTFKRKRARRVARPARTSVSTAGPQRVLDAMASALARDARPDALGELTYYQIKSETGLTDDKLGLALNTLIPRRLCTRHIDEERIYFLPRQIRRQLKARISKDAVMKAA